MVGPFWMLLCSPPPPHYKKVALFYSKGNEVSRVRTFSYPKLSTKVLVYFMVSSNSCLPLFLNDQESHYKNDLRFRL